MNPFQELWLLVVRILRRIQALFLGPAETEDSEERYIVDMLNRGGHRE